MHQYSIVIDDGPIDFNRIAKSGQMFRWRIVENGWEIYDGADYFEVRSKSPIEYEIRSNRDEPIFRSLLRLDQSHSSTLKEIAQRGAELEPFLHNRVGLRLMRPACRRETLFSFLCSSCNHITRITSMVWNLAKLEPEGFPSIDRIADTSESHFRNLGFGYRGASIPRVAAILASNGGDRYLDDLANGDYVHARNELVSLPGVGKKLADCICLFALDFGEAVPVDTHIWQVLTRLYYPDWAGTSLTDKKYEAAAGAFRDRFGDLAGAAHQFLFVDNMERYRER